MPVPDESDCSYADDPVCPYCGDEQGDFWETSGNQEGDGTHDCQNCGRPFRWSCQIDITYSTRPIMGPHRLSEFEQGQDAEENPEAP